MPRGDHHIDLGKAGAAIEYGAKLPAELRQIRSRCGDQGSVCAFVIRWRCDDRFRLTVVGPELHDRRHMKDVLIKTDGVEDLVFLDRSAHRESELMLLIRILLPDERMSRRELAIAQEIKRAAVMSVRS